MHQINVTGMPKRNWWWMTALLTGTALVLSASARKRANTPVCLQIGNVLCRRPCPMHHGRLIAGIRARAQRQEAR